MLSSERRRTSLGSHTFLAERRTLSILGTSCPYILGVDEGPPCCGDPARLSLHSVTKRLSNLAVGIKCRVNLKSHMNGLINLQYVTGSAASETAELVGTVSVALPYPSSPCKGKRSGAPTHMTPARPAKDHDNVQKPATLAPDMTIWS